MKNKVNAAIKKYGFNNVYRGKNNKKQYVAIIDNMQVDYTNCFVMEDLFYGGTSLINKETLNAHFEQLSIYQLLSSITEFERNKQC